MQFLAAAILGALVSGVKTLVGKVLIALGLGWVTYSGVSDLLTWGEQYVKANMSGLPAMVVEIASATKVDVAISILISAISIRMLLNGLTGGSFRKLVSKSQ